MRKLFTLLLLLLTISGAIKSQVAWNQVRVTPYPYTQHIIAGSDTVYFSMLNRSTGKAIGVLPNDSLTGVANDVNYAAADSVVWRIIKGASIGTTPAVRFINIKNGKYLYMGKKGGTTKRLYMGDRVDPLNGSKDFTLTDKGQRVNAEYYYNIVDNEGSILNNLTATSNIGWGASSNTGAATYMFRFYSKKGPQPKVDLMPAPTVEVSTSQAILTVGGSVVIDVKVTKNTADLLGSTKLYLGNTLLTTLSLDANGMGTYTYTGLKKGNVTFTAVYDGCANYEPNDAAATYTVVADPSAKKTVVNLQVPTSSEVHKDVTVNVAVKLLDDNSVVPQGDVLVYINNVIKNRISLDVLGTGSVTFPNLLVGTESIKAIYIGDEQYYLNSDSAKTTIEITPSTASIKPYPVYFDLCDQPEFTAWNRERNMTAASPRPYTKYFPLDSLAGIVVSDTITQIHKVGFNLAGTTYDKIDNAYNRADFVYVPLGSGRPTWVKFKTPWLNAGSYNIYLSHRVSGDPKTNMSSITMDDKELYFPNEEMYGRWFKSWGGVNNRRRWNAKAHSGNMGMNYIGSVNINNSGTHSLKINVLPENGATYNLDMLQFIPVDMDSLNINLPAATSMAKVYYPMFDWVGFARQPGYDVAAITTNYADFTQFAIPYQVADQTDWGKKFSHTIDSIGLKKRLIGTDEYVANYVTIYRAEDKWTRVAEGYGNETTFDFTCKLPVGNYYYETINYTDLADGAQDYRTFISSGTFSVSDDTAIDSHKSSSIKVFANNKTLTVAGISAGARIMVADLTGRILVNEVSKSTLFAKPMPQGIYVVKVLSDEVLRTKVIVK